MNGMFLAVSESLSAELLEAVGWVLLHTIWQFAVMASIGYLLLAWMQKFSAAARYQASMCLLGLLVLTPLASWVVVHHSISHHRQTASRHDRVQQPEVPYAISSETEEFFRPVQDHQASTHAASVPNPPSGAVNPTDKTELVPHSALSTGQPLKQSRFLDWLLVAGPGAIAPWLPSIVMGWAIGVVLCSVRPLLSLFTVWRLRSVGITEPDDQVVKIVNRLQRRLQIRGLVRVFESSKVHVPVVVGCFKSIVLIPIALISNLSLLHLEALIAHELAHVKRYDYVANMFQTIVETLFFYHPAVWWLSNRIRIERENCCDDLAAQVIDNRVEYGRALLALDQWRSATSVLVLGANDGSLRTRIQRLFATQPKACDRAFGLAHGLLGFFITTGLVSGLVFANWKPNQVQTAGHREAISQGTTQDTLFQGEPSQDHAAQDSEAGTNVLRITDETRWEGAMLPGSFLDQLPDVGNVDDPHELVRQLEEGPNLAYILVSGSLVYSWPQGTAPPVERVERFGQQYFRDKVVDPRVRRLIELGPPARDAIHEKILNAKLTVVIPHALTLAAIGDVTSIDLLIQLLEKIDNLGPARGLGPREHAPFAVTFALWELTGQQHNFSPQQWQQWWGQVKPGYIVARDRQSQRLSDEQAAAIAQELLAQLLNEPDQFARDRLISQGPQMISYLQEALSQVQAAGDPPAVLHARAIQLAWVLDELEATQDIPNDLRRRYFALRFSAGDSEGQYMPDPDEVKAFYRAINTCSFADVCRILIDASHMNPRMTWPIRYEMLSRRFHYTPLHIYDPVNSPTWSEVVPAENPTQEIAEAVPVLIAALNDDSPVVRLSAARLSEMLAFGTDQRPDDLIAALAKVWLTDTDPQVRYNAGFAMARSSTPFVLMTFSEGLRSERPEIVSEAVGFYDWISISLNAETRADLELIKTYTKSDDPKLRARAVKVLRNKAPELLFSELERLAEDPVDDIRSSLTYMRIDDGPHEFVEAMFLLAADSKQSIRKQAFSKIGGMKRPDLIPRLRPFLRDQQVWGFALSAIVDSSPEQALVILMAELKAGNDIGGMIYQHLKRITGQDFENQPEPWLEWWRKQVLASDESRRR